MDWWWVVSVLLFSASAWVLREFWRGSDAHICRGRTAISDRCGECGRALTPSGSGR